MRADPLATVREYWSDSLGQMCDYPKLRIAGRRTDMKAMQSTQLKSLVETGNYRPSPALIAEAMLKRRGVRELLVVEPTSIGAAVRTRPAPRSGPRVA